MAAPNGSSNGFSPPRPPYVPKFSAATEMILQRLRGAGGPLAPNSQLSLGNPLSLGTIPPGYEDAKRTLMEGYKTTLSVDSLQPSTAAKPVKTKPRASSAATSKTSTPNRSSGTPTTNSHKGRGSVRGRGRIGRKRKRAKEDESDSPEESDGSASDSEAEEAAFVPTQTLSGRKVVKPAQFTPPVPQEAPAKKKGPAHYNKKTGRNVEQALCKRCSRGNSPNTNQIVFCDQCNNGWHQLCHDPRIGNDIVKDINAPWFCSTCTAKRAAKANKKNTNSTPSSKMPPPAKVTTPTPAPQQKEQKAAGWAGLSTEQKHAYLARFPSQHLISLLVHATTRHPDLPMPPAPPAAISNSPMQNKLSQTYSQQFQASMNHNGTANTLNKQYDQQGNGYPSHAFGTASHLSQNQPAPMMENPIFENSMDVDMNLDSGLDDLSSHMGGSMSGINGQINAAMSMSNGQQHDEDDRRSRESTPASPPYPKPGTGMMARLKTDEESLEWLVGDGSGDEAFSQIVLG